MKTFIKFLKDFNFHERKMLMVEILPSLFDIELRNAVSCLSSLSLNISQKKVQYSLRLFRTFENKLYIFSCGIKHKGSLKKDVFPLIKKQS